MNRDWFWAGAGAAVPGGAGVRVAALPLEQRARRLRRGGRDAGQDATQPFRLHLSYGAYSCGDLVDVNTSHF